MKHDQLEGEQSGAKHKVKVFPRGLLTEEKKPTIIFTLHFFLTSTSVSSTVTLPLPYSFFVGI